jgi:inhibitor of KinA
MQAVIHPLGDCALTILFGEVIDEVVNLRVCKLFKHLQQDSPRFITDIIPAYASLTMVYDVTQVKQFTSGSAYNFVKAYAETVLAHVMHGNTSQGRLVQVPVCYHSTVAPGLTDFCEMTGLPVDQVVQLHTERIYRVYMIGFLPGFPYMGVVDEAIALPRKPAPVQVHAGSVGIAGSQTGIYPFDSPGGWNIIGRTPLKIFDHHATNPCVFAPGDRVQFQSVSIDEFYELQG